MELLYWVLIIWGIGAILTVLWIYGATRKGKCADELRRLKDDTDAACRVAQDYAAAGNRLAGAINFSDLGCVHAEIVRDSMGVNRVRVLIEEADPRNPAFHSFVKEFLGNLGWGDVEVETEW